MYFFIKAETIKDSISSNAMNSHKDITNNISKHTNKEKRKDIRIEILLIEFSIIKDKITNKHSETNYKSLSNKYKYTSDIRKSCKSNWVSKTSVERIMSRSTKRLSSNCTHHISLLVKESNESLETIQIALTTSTTEIK